MLPDRSPAKPDAAAGRRSIVLPAVLSVGVMVLIGPDVFLTTIPANSDLPSHFLTLEALRTQLLSSGRIHGWSHAWFTGFPLFYFYFPLPSLVGAVLGMVLHPGLAIRLVVLAGPMSLPWALWCFGRWSGIGKMGTYGVVLAGALFLLMSSQHTLGGNILSTLAGEFSYSWSLSLSLLYLAMVTRSVDRGRWRFLPGITLAGALLSHVLPAGIAALASARGLLHQDLRRATLRSWSVAAGLTAFWTLPLIFRIGYIGNREWSYVPRREDYLPAEVLLLVGAAALGLWLLRRNHTFTTLGLAGLLALATAMLPQELVGRGRLIPFWALAVHVLAGAAVGGALASGRRRLMAGGVVLGLIPFLLVASTRDLRGIRTFSHRILEGIESKPGATELQALVSELARQPTGRVHFESTVQDERWGGPLAFSLLPLWTSHTTLSGLLGESSPLLSTVRRVDRMLASDPNEPIYPDAEEELEVPYDPASGVTALRELGVRYLVTTTEGTRLIVAGLEGVRSLGSFGDLHLHDLGVSPPVLLNSGAPAPIDDFRLEPLGIRFRTAEPGVPHLVRVSFFPNWRSREGERVRRSGPFFMTLVPRSEQVTLEFRPTWVERLGTLVSALTVAALGMAGTRRALLARGAGESLG